MLIDLPGAQVLTGCPCSSTVTVVTSRDSTSPRAISAFPSSIHPCTHDTPGSRKALG